jgi:hypothetical protein
MLTSTIPYEIGYLIHLQELFLFNNFLIGSIPSEIGNMFLLEDLDLKNNVLTGVIPSELGTLVNVRNIFLQNNKFTGKIDNVFNYSIQVMLEAIDLSSNQLSASSLDNLYLLPRLRVLALSGRSFEET